MTKPNKKAVLSVLNIGARLLVICLAVAAIVSLVNELTKARYAEILVEERKSAMTGIFGVTELSYHELVDGIYEIMAEDQLLGYCVQATTAGFGGDMSLMVGFSGDRSLRGVQILSHSETPGLGARVNDASYLAQYNGKTGTLQLGSDIDAISGATISSRAVLAGVSAAQTALENALKGGY